MKNRIVFFLLGLAMTTISCQSESGQTTPENIRESLFYQDSINASSRVENLRTELSQQRRRDTLTDTTAVTETN